jgi:hypothetical protein
VLYIPVPIGKGEKIENDHFFGFDIRKIPLQKIFIAHCFVIKTFINNEVFFFVDFFIGIVIDPIAYI